MIDTHCHIQFNAYKDDFEQVIEKCRQKGMLLNVVGSNSLTSVKAVEFADKYDSIFATVGMHPSHTFSTYIDQDEDGIGIEKFNYEYYKKLADHPKVIGIGECGLELYHLPENINREEILLKQKDTFVAQSELARELELPLVIHVRDAHEEMIELLNVIARSETTKQSFDRVANYKIAASPSGAPRNDKTMQAVIHCYTGDWKNAEQYLAMGFYLGFTGVITFPPKKTNPQLQLDLLEVVKNCPADRILIETDAPYLAPQAYRGERCEPWMVEEVAKKIAEIKNISLAEVVKITTKNAKKLFTKLG